MSALLVVVLVSSMFSSCSDETQRVEASSPQTSAESSDDFPPRRVRLEVGHCYVEPAPFAEGRWGLRFSEQFGRGGPQYYPEDWMGAGVLTRVAEDRVLYTDDGGAELTLLPADSPAVARAEEVPCR